MKKRRSQTWKPWRLLTGIAVGIIASGVALALYLQGKDIPVLDPQGIVGIHERNLIIFTCLLSVVVVVPVFVMLGVFAWKYREDNTKAEYRPDEEGNKWLEILWWGIPILIIAVLGTVTWITTHQLDPYRPLDSNVKPLRVQVVALQWKWLFLYPDQRVATVNELKIPAGTPINFELTADAPMSAFWIPSLGTQVYAMSGMTSKLSLQADKPGTYRGTNTNINGEGYADMHFTVTSVEPRDFTHWTEAIEKSSSHNHMGWDEYEELAKPETAGRMSYYHLHDTNLFNQVLGKYNGNGMTMHDDSHEGGQH